MKLKKSLAMLIAIAMVLTAMCTPVFAAKSEPEVTIKEETAPETNLVSDVVAATITNASTSKNNTYDDIDEAFDALAKGDTITIAAGTHYLNNSDEWHPRNAEFCLPDDVTIIGEEGAVIEREPCIYAKGLTIKNVDFKGYSYVAMQIRGNAVFEDCTLDGPNGIYYSTVSGKLKFIDCTVRGDVYGLHVGEGTGDVIIDGCTISGWNTFGNVGVVEISNTTFRDDSDYNYLGFYQEAIMTDCEFYPGMEIGAQSTATAQITLMHCTVTDGSDISKLVLDDSVNNTTIINAPLPNAEVANLGAMTINDYNIYTGSLTEGTTPIDLQIAMEFLAKDTPEEAAENAFGNYTTDFFITIDGMTGDSIVGDGCYLAGNYGTFGWIMIPLDGMTIEEGKIYPVITTVGFDFKYVDICTSVKDFKCGIFFSDDVISQNADMTVKLELGLSKNIDAAQEAKYITVDTPYIYAAADFGKVAQVGDTTYSTLEAAIENANGEEIKMLSNVSLSSPIKIEKNQTVTIDLNGKSILYSADVVGETMITNSGNLVINDATNEGKILYIYTGSPDTSYSKGNYTVDNRGSMTINGGAVEIAAKGCNGKFAHALYAVENYSGFDLTINGGRVYNANNVAVRAFGAGDIAVNGGEIEGLRAIWLQLPSSDASVAPVVNLTVTDGTLTGTGIGESSDNKLAIYSYSYGNDMKNVSINISGGTFNGDIALTGGSNKQNIETVNVTGGAFNGKYGDLYSYAEDAAAADAITITGGTFASDYAEIYCKDDGYSFEKNADNTFGVVEKSSFETLKHGGVFDGIGKLSFNAKYLDFSSADDITYGMYIYVENNGVTNGVKLDGGNKLTQEWFHTVVDEISEANYGQNVMCIPYVTVNGITIFGDVMVSNVNQFLQ